MNTIACSIIRGGSSKGVFFDERDLPADTRERDRLLLSVMGSPDPRQVDGLGGGDPLTSKVAIIAPGQVAGADLEYESIEVGVGSEVVNRGIMCGNLASGVSLFAAGAGMLPARAHRADVRIHCRSNGKFIVARRLDGQVWTDLAQPAGSAAEIGLRFEDPAGAVTGRLLPLGQALSRFTVDGAVMTASVADAGTLYAFVPAKDLDCRGDEAPAALDADNRLRERVESLRVAVMSRINATLGTQWAPRRLKVAMVSVAERPGDGHAAEGEGMLSVRILNPARVHKAWVRWLPGRVASTRPARGRRAAQAASMARWKTRRHRASPQGLSTTTRDSSVPYTRVSPSPLSSTRLPTSALRLSVPQGGTARRGTTTA